jgi:hypothetical protein
VWSVLLEMGVVVFSGVELERKSLWCRITRFSGFDKRGGSLTLDRKDYLNAYGKVLVLWMSTSRAKAEPDVCSLMKYCENKKHHASIRYTVSL